MIFLLKKKDKVYLLIKNSKVRKKQRNLTISKSEHFLLRLKKNQEL